MFVTSLQTRHLYTTEHKIVASSTGLSSGTHLITHYVLLRSLTPNSKKRSDVAASPMLLRDLDRILVSDTFLVPAFRVGNGHVVSAHLPLAHKTVLRISPILWSTMLFILHDVTMMAVPPAHSICTIAFRHRVCSHTIRTRTAQNAD